MKSTIVNNLNNFTYEGTTIKYKITEDNELQLYVNDCAKALGITQTKIRHIGKLTTYIRWERVYEDLVSIDSISNLGLFKSLEKETKSEIRKKLKTMKISLNNALLWSKRVQSFKSNNFIQLLSNLNNDVLNNECIIIKEIPKRKELEFLDKLEQSLNPLHIKGIKQCPILSYRIDYYIPSFNISIEYDENDHKGYTYEQQELRQALIEKELGCKFIRVSDKRSDEYNIGLIFKELFQIAC